MDRPVTNYLPSEVIIATGEAISQSSPSPDPSSNPKYQFSSERLSLASEGLRLWVGKAWKIGVLMAKGAYLLGERRRLLLKLGEEAFGRMKVGEWKSEDLDQLVKQLERVSKKIEIEEKLIQSARFGSSGAPESHSRPEESHNNQVLEPETPKPEKESKEKGKSK